MELIEAVGRSGRGRLHLDQDRRVLVHTRPDGGRTPVFASAHQLRSLMQLLVLLDDSGERRDDPLDRGVRLLLDLLDRNPVHAVLGVAHLRRAAMGDTAVAVPFGGEHRAAGPDDSRSTGWTVRPARRHPVSRRPAGRPGLVGQLARAAHR